MLIYFAILEVIFGFFKSEVYVTVLVNFRSDGSSDLHLEIP